MTTVCEPIFKLLKKNQPVIWDDKCQQDFVAIKNYLMNPPVLQPLKLGKSLILYLEIEKDVIGAMLDQEGEERAEHAVYYLSKKLLQYEANYSLVEKTCLAVIWATKKLRIIFNLTGCRQSQSTIPSDIYNRLPRLQKNWPDGWYCSRNLISIMWQRRW